MDDLESGEIEREKSYVHSDFCLDTKIAGFHHVKGVTGIKLFFIQRSPVLLHAVVDESADYLPLREEKYNENRHD